MVVQQPSKPDVDGAGPIPATEAWTTMDQRSQAIFRKQRSGFRASVF